MLAPALAVVAVFFVGGLGAALAQSLGYQPYLGEHDLSWDAYRTVWADPAVRASTVLTVRTAVLATGLAAVFGVGIALGIQRLGRSRAWAARLMQANLAVPHLVAAVSIQLLLSQSGMISRLAATLGLTQSPADFPALTADAHGIGILAALVWKETPFLAVLALTALGGATHDLGRCARVLGADRWQRLRHVTVPALAPAVAAGSVLVFAFAVGAYEIPYLLGRPYPATLPVLAYELYTDVDLAARPEAMVLAVLIA
ncbi:MAG: ABC transporter permease subunit, partial [Nocardioidaceae bacterium]|nr:ABC transporter permease subunit [Nocardioidaceae bacterium]